MRIDELKKIAEENDYTFREDDAYGLCKFARVINGECALVNQISVSMSFKNKIYICTKYCDGKDFNMIKAATEFAETDPEDREEEKKFYLEHRYFKCTNGDSRYFQILESDGTPWLNAMYTVMGYKKQFTLKEIEEIKEEFDTDLKDFELVEVKE